MNKVYVGNLPYNTTEDDLQQFFTTDNGCVEDINIISDRRTGRSKGFAFVAFDTNEAMQSALSKNGEELQGRSLKINEAREKEERSES